MKSILSGRKPLICLKRYNSQCPDDLEKSHHHQNQQQQPVPLEKLSNLWFWDPKNLSCSKHSPSTVRKLNMLWNALYGSPNFAVFLIETTGEENQKGTNPIPSGVNNDFNNFIKKEKSRKCLLSHLRTTLPLLMNTSKTVCTCLSSHHSGP